MQQSLFPDMGMISPETEGIKYAGSKLRLMPYIIEVVEQVKPKTVLDGFSGTTRVSQAFARMGYKVFANDIAAWSYTFGLCYLKNTRPHSYYQDILDHLNHLMPIDGWFTEHYGGSADDGDESHTDGLKRPWQRHNTRKLDAIRSEIECMDLGEVEKAVVLTSLILALDKVDSTLGHFVSYLNKWSARSYNTMQLEVPKLIQSQQAHQVYQSDIFDVISNVQADLAYYDPPYGSNNEKMPPSRVRYAAYYHLWTTVCLNDQPPLFGKANRRTDSSDKVAGSVFEDFRKTPDGGFVVVEAIEQLLQQSQSYYVLLSYSSGGRATAEALHDILSSAGTIVDVRQVDYRRNIMATMRWTHQWVQDSEQPHIEYLFLLKR